MRTFSVSPYLVVKVRKIPGAIASSRTSAEAAEHVVVARGGVVPGDDGEHVKAERPEVIDAAADAQPGAPARTLVTAVGVVPGDRAVGDTEARAGADEGATPGAIAPVTTGPPPAPDGQ